MTSIAQRIADELNIQLKQVEASISLIDDGASIPFIARYRKELTGSLDDTQLRRLDERLSYLKELEQRRTTILSSIEEQGKLDEALKQRLLAADNKATLEDLYLPFKPKRRTKGAIAIDAGLEPLANMLFQQPELEPHICAQDFLKPDQGITDSKAALDGAKYILMERFSEDAALLAQLKRYLWDQGLLSSKVVSSEQHKGEKFRDYFDYQEALKKVPSHRALALFRGRKEGVLSLSLELENDAALISKAPHPCEQRIAHHVGISDSGRPADSWLAEVVRWTWRVRLSLHIETELLARLREQAERVASEVFAENLKDLLLAAPAGAKVTMGLDPGLRTGVKVAIVDHTGKLLDHTTIYPHAPKKQWDKAIETLATLARQHQVELVSIGNGTASRETDSLVAELAKRYPELRLTRIMVSEAGASVYSASELAAQEFPDLDVTIRGAVSIARRLQDPLAELVKIEPKAIGVGQYQHDVSQLQLNRSLSAVVEDCVNAVGVDVNTASAPLLAHVSGLSRSIANNVIDYRDLHGSFRQREQLKKVPRLGAKAFEQCAGFLRIRDGDNVLDASAVHPESYPLVASIAAASGHPIESLIGNPESLSKLAANDFTDAHNGVITVQDIISELAKPGRDPRPEFTFASYKEGVEKISDLVPEMILEGCVTNVTHFGAFVDIGVHQDGLVHISALANRFIKDPRDVVKTGDIVKVKVIEIDQKRNRIALSMRLADRAEPACAKTNTKQKANAAKSTSPNKQHSATTSAGTSQASMTGAMAAAFANINKH